MSPDANLEVDGCTLQIDYLSCSVSFSTSTDALFASFILKHDTIPWQIFDDLLSILHLDRFNNKELTFKKSLDIYLDIAERRRSEAAGREHRSVPSDMVSGDGLGQIRVPKLVVELVADQLEQERASHIDEQLEQSLSVVYSPKNVDEALQNMALVHRSWTGVTQQKLRKRINVRPTKNTLRSRLLDLHIGPWVQEVWFGGYQLGGWGIVENNDEEMHLLRVILQRCPNIRLLLLGKVSYASPQSMNRDAILHLRNLSSLEHFWIYRDVREQDFSDLCISVIPELHSLKGLYISADSSWQQSASQMPSHLIGTTPSASLRRLSLLSHSDYGESRWLHLSSYLYWLFMPRNGYTPKILELNANDVLGSSESVSRFIEVLLPLMPSIESLHLRHSSDYIRDTRTNVLQRFTSLQQLQLYEVLRAPEMPLCLPTTIREFHIRFGRMYSSWHPEMYEYPTLDTCIASQLQIMPNLREVLISIVGGTTDTFPSTTALCASRSISLILT